MDKDMKGFLQSLGVVVFLWVVMALLWLTGLIIVVWIVVSILRWMGVL